MLYLYLLIVILFYVLSFLDLPSCFITHARYVIISLFALESMQKVFRGIYVYFRMFWFIKIKNKLTSLSSNSLTHCSKLTLESNRRRVVSDISLPPHPTAKTLLGLDLDVFGSKSSVYLNYIKLKYYHSKLRRKSFNNWSP